MSDAPPGWVPEFEGQRPPFQQGHTLSLRSGAWSPRVVDPIAAQLLAEVASDPATAYLSQPAYAATVRSWATAQARAEVFAEWLFAKPLEEQLRPPRGGAKSPLEVWQGLVRTAAGLADRLGLTPLARARLGRDVAAASVARERLDEWMARGAEMARRDGEGGADDGAA